MKKLITLLLVALALNVIQAQPYYSCNTPNGANATSSSDGSGSCNVTSGTWSASTMTIRTGSTLDIPNNTTITITGTLTIESGGVLGDANNGGDITVASGGALIVNGSIALDGNNSNIIVQSGGALTVLSTGVISTNGNTNNTIDFNAGSTISISGSVTSTGAITINSNNVTIADNAAFDKALTGTATSITLKRNFNRVGWQHMNFPVTAASAKTLGNLTAAGGVTLTYATIPTSTVFLWTTTATTSSWELPTAGTALADQPFDIYVGSVPASISLSVTPAQINSAVLATQAYIYSVPPPSSTPPGNGIGWTTTITDGWVMRANPFQSFLSSDLLGLTGTLDNAVYVWNGGPNYVTRAGGVGAAEFISPNQSFFIHCTAAGTYSVPLAARNYNPTTKPNYFKAGNQVVLNLIGEGHVVDTYIAENPSSTEVFDGAFDAHYLYPTTNFPTFNTVGRDSTAYSVNQVPDLTANPIYVSFFYEKNNKNFTISIDQAMANNVNLILLEDTYTQTLTDLKNYDYSFTSNRAAPAQRFKLHFSQSSIGIAEMENGSNFKVWVNNNELRFDENENLEGATINVYNTNGQLIASGTTVNPIYVEKAGVYVVNVLTKEGRAYNVKVVKL